MLPPTSPERTAPGFGSGERCDTDSDLSCVVAAGGAVEGGTLTRPAGDWSGADAYGCVGDASCCDAAELPCLPQAGRIARERPHSPAPGDPP